MKLFIMTRGRVGRQETIKWIPPKWLPHTYLVCPSYEEGQHSHQHLVAPAHVTNYSEKFQWLMEYPDEKVVIMDDDLCFSRKEGTKLITIKERNPSELNALWNQMEELLDTTLLVGVHPRQMGHLAKTPYVQNQKVICIQGINTTIMRRAFNGVPKVDWFPIMSDQYFAMAVLSAGYDIKLITTFCQDHGPSQAPGGCDYRTKEMQEAAVRYLAETFGPYAKLEVKRPKAAKWLGDERLDLRVQWKQMYQAGLAARQARQHADLAGGV
jgi:hypothetical protein